MQTRRNFITKIGIGAIAPQALFARQPDQPHQPERRRRSIVDMLFGNAVTAPAQSRPDPTGWDNSTITAAWIGHATVLINFFGTTIITDPVFSRKIGIRLLGLTTVGPQRLVEPALTIDELPPIDLILLSHAHFDHMDLPSIRRLNPETPVVVAKNTRDILESRGRANIQELDWGERATAAGIEIEALRVRHFGWRYPWEHDRSRGDADGRSFNAYLLSKNGKHIVFGGDTAYQDFFTSLAARKIGVELAIMPIGAYDPWIYVHANPEEAVTMARHMNAKAILPIHWNTFTLSAEPQREPIERLKIALAGQSIQLAVDDIGQTWKLPS